MLRETNIADLTCFKTGDRVRIVNDFCHKTTCNWSGQPIGYEFYIDEIFDGEWAREKRGVVNGVHLLCLELVNNNNNMTNLKEKFVLAMTAEPEKSFRKAGITNGDGLLTDEGTKVFLTWLLSKNATDFKKEVVDSLLAEDK